MTDQQPGWVDSGSGPGWNAPRMALPRLSRLRGIRPAIPGPTVPMLAGPSGDGDVPPHVKADALKTILERHVTGADGVCFCGDRTGEFTGRCPVGRKAAQRLTALGFMGYEVPASPPGKSEPE